MKLLRYILCLSFLLPAGGMIFAQSGLLDEQLDRYESMCGKCLDMKSLVKAGENVGRQQAKTLIEGFLELNKSLKAYEPDMTASQRYRFASIGTWFSTGTKPVPMPCDVPLPQLLSPFGTVCVTSLCQSCLADVSSCDPGAECNVPAALSSDPDIVSRNYRGDIFVLATLAAPDLSYGLMAGYQHERWGGYLNFRSNYIFGTTSYSCTSDGVIEDGSRFWPSGKDRVSVMHVSAGVLAGVLDWLAIYAGAGYGYRRLAWEDVDGSWALVSDWSRSGLAAECGVIPSWRNLTFSAGVSTISFKTVSFTCGVGIRF